MKLFREEKLEEEILRVSAGRRSLWRTGTCIHCDEIREEGEHTFF
jgi:hypothetical protein